MAEKGRYTQPNVWDKAAHLRLWRRSAGIGKLEKLDPGVNYFVAMLEQMGTRTFFSCEGHPQGFYVVFAAPYKKALKIAERGFSSVEIAQGGWSIRIGRKQAESGRVDCLRWAAEAWEKELGPLDFKRIVLSPSNCAMVEKRRRRVAHKRNAQKRTTL